MGELYITSPNDLLYSIKYSNKHFLLKLGLINILAKL